MFTSASVFHSVIVKGFLGIELPTLQHEVLEDSTDDQVEDAPNVHRAP